MMRAHPAADLFPMMTDEEVGALAVDIKSNGLRQPIVLIEESGERMILDGRNRARACAIADVETRTIMFAGDDPYALVCSANLLRRHLSVTERSFIAEQLASLRLGANQHTEGRPAGSPSVTAREDAARLLNVGITSVTRARRVLERGVPELVAAVKSETISLTAGADLAGRPAVEQRERLAAGAESVGAWSNDRRRAREELNAPPKRSFMHDDKPAKEIRPGLVLVKSEPDALPTSASWDERTALAQRLAAEDWPAEDISRRTGIKKTTLWTLIKGHRPKKNVLEGALDDVESFAESWNRYARGIPTQWKTASEKEWKQLSVALKAASKAAMKMVRRLNKEANEVDDEACEVEAQ